jgi:hypothetical protein
VQLLRVSTVNLMVVILYLGLGLAALTKANAIWASLVFSTSVVANSATLAIALVAKAGSRVVWAGYATAGWACLIIWLATPATTGYVNGPPNMFIMSLSKYFINTINNRAAVGGQPLIDYYQVARSLDVIMFGLSGAFLCRMFAARKTH